MSKRVGHRGSVAQSTLYEAGMILRSHWRRVRFLGFSFSLYEDFFGARRAVGDLSGCFDFYISSESVLLIHYTPRFRGQCAILGMKSHLIHITWLSVAVFK